MHETEIMNSVIYAVGPRHRRAAGGRKAPIRGCWNYAQVCRMKHYFFKGAMLRECIFFASIVRDITGKACVPKALHILRSKQNRSMLNTQINYRFCAPGIYDVIKTLI